MILTWPTTSAAIAAAPSTAVPARLASDEKSSVRSSTATFRTGDMAALSDLTSQIERG